MRRLATVASTIAVAIGALDASGTRHTARRLSDQRYRVKSYTALDLS